MKTSIRHHVRTALLAFGLTLAAASGAKDINLLNVSYDPTREFYREFNAAFAADWQKTRGRRSVSRPRTAVPASRRARSSTAWKPTW